MQIHAQERHNDMEMQVFATLFTRHRDDLGPDGTTIACGLSDGGKTNKNHNRHYKAMMPHRNPLLCALGVEGALYLYRFGHMGEDIPHWQDTSAFFETYTLRQASSPKQHVSYSAMNACFKRLYAAAEVHCAKVPPSYAHMHACAM